MSWHGLPPPPPPGWGARLLTRRDGALCWGCCLYLAGNLQGSTGVHQQSDNETVKTYLQNTVRTRNGTWEECILKRTQDFSENEDKNHADEETGLLGGSTDTSITDNTDGETVEVGG